MNTQRDAVLRADRDYTAAVKRLPQSVQTVLAQIASSPHVEKLVLFGSRAIGDFESTSDVDIAIVSLTMTARDLVTLRAIADEGPSLYWITVLHYDAMEAGLRDRIDDTGVVIYERA